MGFSKILKGAGIKHVRFHDLRHTHASLLIKAGVNIKIISERLGHSSIRITMDTYGHLLPGMQEIAAEAWEGILSKATAPSQVTVPDLD